MIIPKTVNKFLAFFLEPESKIISFTSYRRVPQNFCCSTLTVSLVFFHLEIHENQGPNVKPFSCSYATLNTQICGSEDTRKSGLHDMKTHSAALHGTLNLRIWRYMKIRTKMKNHSTALNVTPNLQILLI